MKKLILIAVTSVAMTSFADDIDSSKVKDIPECKNISTQCEAAGFKSGGHKENKTGLWVDCIGKVAKGETVQGITASADEAKTCATVAKAQRADKKEERAERKKMREEKKKAKDEAKSQTEG